MSKFIGDNPDKVYAFIQWKGTDVCMDFHCKCGAQCHFDGDFAYSVKCANCETVWEMPCYIFPREVTAEIKKNNFHWSHNEPKLSEKDHEDETE